MQTVSMISGNAFMQVDLHEHTLIVLREAVPADGSSPAHAALGRYIDYVVQERASVWRRALSDLEDAGWGSNDISVACARLVTELFLHHFEIADVVTALGYLGLKKHARRVRGQPKLARALLCVALELRAENAACRSEIGRVRALRKRTVGERARGWLRDFAP
jgi:hypothetical protein